MLSVTSEDGSRHDVGIASWRGRDTDTLWERAVTAIEDVADSLRVIAAREARETPQSKAIRLLLELGPDNLAAIARAVGVHRGSMYRWPQFREALERIRASSQWAKRNPRAVSADELSQV